jgi:hypothetical protein
MMPPTHKMAAGDGPALFWPEDLLGGSRFISPPFFGRNKAHARAVAFVVARGLAGILERRVAAGSVPAGAHFSCKLGRDSRWAAAHADRWFSVLQILTSHRSSLFACPGSRSCAPGTRSLSLASALADIKNVRALREAQTSGARSLRGMNLPYSLHLCPSNYNPD